jgi:hypothetical protein
VGLPKEADEAKPTMPAINQDGPEDERAQARG